MVYSGYTGKSVTVPVAITSLLTLIRTVKANCPGTCRSVQIQTPSDNPGVVYFGESAVADDDFGYAMVGGSTKTYASEQSDIPLSAIFVIGSVADNVLNVEVLW